mgnify:CR=1 FL=1
MILLMYVQYVEYHIAYNVHIIYHINVKHAKKDFIYILLDVGDVIHNVINVKTQHHA